MYRGMVVYQSMSKREMTGDILSLPLPGLVRLEVSSKFWANIPIPDGREARVATQMVTSFTFHVQVIVGAILRAPQGPVGVTCGK